MNELSFPHSPKPAYAAVELGRLSAKIDQLSADLKLMDKKLQSIRWQVRMTRLWVFVIALLTAAALWMTHARPQRDGWDNRAVHWQKAEISL